LFPFIGSLSNTQYCANPSCGAQDITGDGGLGGQTQEVLQVQLFAADAVVHMGKHS